MIKKRFKLFLILILLFIIFFLPGYSINSDYTPFSLDQVKTLFSSQTRYVVSLSGSWQRSYDGVSWENVNIPSSELSPSKVTYQRTLKIGKELLDKYVWHLEFLGIDDQVAIYINEQFIGRYFGALTPMDIKIPQKLITGETNTLKLEITPSSLETKEKKAQNLFAKKLYSGIIRELFLIGTPNIWISDIRYQTSFNNEMTSSKVKTSISISSGETDRLLSQNIKDSAGVSYLHSRDLTVEASIRKKPTGELVSQSPVFQVKIERERTIVQNIDLDVNSPVLWSLQNPALYELQVKITSGGVLIDNYNLDIGFRSITIKSNNNEQGIYINGKLFELKGINYIEDFSEVGQTLNSKKMEDDILQIKTLGANLIRFKFSPPHPYMLHLCNKYGILALIELPVYDIPSQILQYDELKVRMKNISQKLINVYDIFPSVMGWGISDGLEDGISISKEFNKSLLDIFNSNSNKLKYKIVHFRTKQFETDGFDFIGFRDNRLSSDYETIVNEIIRLKAVCKKPVFITYGTLVQPDNHNGYSDKSSIEYQAYNIRNIFHIVKDKECAGSIINSFNDYELDSPLLITDNKEQYIATSGLVDRQRRERLAYQTLQALFNNEQEPLLFVGNYSETTPVFFIVSGLLLGIIIIFLINRFRRFREYIFRAVLRPYNFYADIRDQRIMSNVQNIMLGLVISFTLALFFASILYFYRNNELAQYLYMMVLPSNNLKEFLFRILWMPELLMFVLALITLIVVFIISFIIRVFAFFLHAKVFINDALTITIWSGAPLLALLPLSIVLVRMLAFSPSLIWIIAVIPLVLFLWVSVRLLRCSSVVFDKRAFKVYLTGISIFVIAFGVPLSIYHFNYSIFAYLQYFIDVLLKN